MDNKEQNKILDELKKGANNDNKNKVYENLKNKIDDFKNKKIKLKTTEDDEEEDNDYLISNKKKFKKSIK